MPQLAAAIHQLGPWAGPQTDPHIAAKVAWDALAVRVCGSRKSAASFWLSPHIANLKAFGRPTRGGATAADQTDHELSSLRTARFNAHYFACGRG
jgi:hypothetical protein